MDQEGMMFVMETWLKGWYFSPQFLWEPELKLELKQYHQSELEKEFNVCLATKPVIV